MDTMLIATDFSAASRNATIYGFELARQLKAKVILFTAYQMPATFPESASYLTASEVEENMYKKLLDDAETIDPRRTVSLATQCRQGPVNISILEAAVENKVSFIIVGMKETGKEVRKYFGSTVTHLCKNSTLPLIVVPADAEFSIPKTIALASDITDKTDVHILNPLKKIAENFNSKLFIVRVIKKSMDEVVERFMRSERLNWFLTTLNPTYEFTKAENVAKAMNVFVAQHDVNMVAVIPHEHTLFERLFTRSVTKDLVFRTLVPLLILPFTKSESKSYKGSTMYTSTLIQGVH